MYILAKEVYQMANEYLTAKEACQYLGVSRTTLNIYVREGKLKQYVEQAPKRIFYKQSELASLKGIKLREN
jgi:predicted site-specific integrase-resolvase